MRDRSPHGFNLVATLTSLYTGSLSVHQVFFRTGKTMKQGIHPDYMDTAVNCGCGHSFTTRSTVEKLTVEICSACHPFYTGQMKYVDSAGRVEKFQKKYNWGKKTEEPVDESADATADETAETETETEAAAKE